MEDFEHDFCRDSFWNGNLTSNFEFTQCFQDTVLVGSAPLIFLLMSPFWFWFIWKKNHQHAQYPPPKKKVSTISLKVLVLLVITASVIYNYVTRWSAEDSELFLSDVVGPAFQIISFLFIFILIFTERRLNVHTSPIQFYFWLFSFFTSIPQFVKNIQILVEDTSDVSVWISTISGPPLILIKVILHCISDNSSDSSSTQPPESDASHVTFFLFSWMNKIIWKG